MKCARATTSPRPEWARTALQLSLDHGPSYIAQTINAAIPLVRRHSPADAAVLLGALRAHRDRKHQDGTTPEIEAEIRYESSLRRALGAGIRRVLRARTRARRGRADRPRVRPTRRDHRPSGRDLTHSCRGRRASVSATRSGGLG